MRKFIPMYIALAMLMTGPDASAYDAVVSKDGSGEYSTIQSAVDHAPSGRTAPWTIYVKSGAYEEQVIVPEEKRFIHLVGENKDNTVLHLRLNVGAKPKDESEPFWASSVHNPGSPVYRYAGAVLNVKGADFHAENLSIINDFGVEAQSGPMALAVKLHVDRVSFDNCIVRSYQDTWQTSGNDAHRLYVRNSFIEGAVDYIFGGGDALFENCTLYNSRKSSVIVAPCQTHAEYGYVFRDCRITGNADAAKGDNKFGRPWHNTPKAVFIHTAVLIPMAAEGWTEMGGLPALFAEYGSVDAQGQRLDVSARKTTYTNRETPPRQSSCPAEITGKEADTMVYKNIISRRDGWNPRMY